MNCRFSELSMVLLRLPTRHPNILHRICSVALWPTAELGWHAEDLITHCLQCCTYLYAGRHTTTRRVSDKQWQRQYTQHVVAVIAKITDMHTTDRNRMHKSTGFDWLDHDCALSFFEIHLGFGERCAIDSHQLLVAYIHWNPHTKYAPNRIGNKFKWRSARLKKKPAFFLCWSSSMRISVIYRCDE